MDEKLIKAVIPDWVEPAHPAFVKLHDVLTKLYESIREHSQRRIDAAFDDIARQVGFVVTTTVPVALKVGEKGGMIERIEIDAEHLKGTLFEKGIVGALQPMLKTPVDGISAGDYKILVIWHDALKLKLRKDWMEPAHVSIQTALRGFGLEKRIRVADDVREPAHWFDPGVAVAVEEAVLISAIDQVYPDLKLLDRISAGKEAIRRAIPDDVKEPAHSRPSQILSDREFMSELVNLIERFSR